MYILQVHFNRRLTQAQGQENLAKIFNQTTGIDLVKANTPRADVQRMPRLILWFMRKFGWYKEPTAVYKPSEDGTSQGVKIPDVNVYEDPMPEWIQKILLDNGFQYEQRQFLYAYSAQTLEEAKQVKKTVLGQIDAAWNPTPLDILQSPSTSLDGMPLSNEYRRELWLDVRPKNQQMCLESQHVEAKIIDFGHKRSGGNSGHILTPGNEGPNRPSPFQTGQAAPMILPGTLPTLDANDKQGSDIPMGGEETLL